MGRIPDDRGPLLVAPGRLCVVVDRRAVIGRCLCLWIGALGPELSSVSMASIDDFELSKLPGQADAVIFCTGVVPPGDDVWLREQVARAHRSLPEVPIVLFAESSDPRLAEATANQLPLSGYIPTCSSLELAATALRLILAGGHYVPREHSNSAAVVAPGQEAQLLQPAVAPVCYDKLSHRERSVLDLLEFGLPNKVIGYRLGMSPSTVKAHVHNIIAKLNVRNRTEAAVARFALSIRQTSIAPRHLDNRQHLPQGIWAIEASERFKPKDVVEVGNDPVKKRQLGGADHRQCRNNRSASGPVDTMRLVSNGCQNSAGNSRDRAAN